MICNKCNNTVTSESKFCDKCGADLRNAPLPVTTPPPTPITPPTPHTPLIAGEHDPRFDYTPLGMWTYFGYNLLFAIPLVGFILLLVFSFGGTRNINLRNYARSFFCWMIILAVIFVIVLFFITVVLGTTLGSLL